MNCLLIFPLHPLKDKDENQSGSVGDGGGEGKYDEQGP